MAKNICILKDDISVGGGSERVAINLANGLAKYYKIIIVSITKRDEFIFESCSDIEVCFLSNSKRNRSEMFTGVIKLRKHLKENKIDTVISIGISANFFAIGSAVGTNIKTIVTEHSNIKNCFNHHFGETLCRWIGVKYADKVITLTQADRTAYIEKYKLNENKINYIYNFVDDRLLQNENNYNHESKIILSVGRFDRVKGYEMLVRVAKSVLTRHIDWQWHIYGDGDKVYKEEIRNMIHSFGLEKHVILMGESSEIYDVYKDAAIFVLTSYFEGLPMVLLEAKANYLPIVSFDCMTGPGELIEDKKSGFLIETYNEEKMAEKICSLIGDVDMRVSFSSHAQDNLAKFDRKVIIEKWINLIESI